jgi:UDP-N-acetylglucosamine acyltransferase
VSRGTKATGKTVVGDNCLLMNYSHVGHDCVLGNNVILANNTSIGGHVVLGDWAILGGYTGIHQFCKVGKHVMLAARCILTKDVPPFILAGGNDPKYRGLNVIGLRRRGFSNERIEIIKEAYDIIYRSNYNVSDGINKIKDSIESNTDINDIITFIEESTRGIIPI